MENDKNKRALSDALDWIKGRGDANEVADSVKKRLDEMEKV